MDNLMSVGFSSDDASVYDIRDVNSSFALGNLRVMYLGENRNGSSFSKESVEKALPSLYNVPIVCNWDDETGEIGGHDVAVVSDDKGMRLKNLTEPCGVVPECAKFSFQKLEDKDGNEHEYLVIEDVILWKRQDVYRHIVEDLNGKVDHSMEINVREYSKLDDGVLDITDFEFTALCLLEKYEPCFQGSNLQLYALAATTNFKQKMNEMMDELRACFTTVSSFSSFKKDDDMNQENTEGGETVLENEKEFVEVETTDEEIVSAAEADNASFSESAENEIQEEANAAGDLAKNNDAFVLNSNVEEELIRRIREPKTEKPWGLEDKYWFVDFDLEKGEVYCVDTDEHALYGFAFQLDGDAVKIDFNSKKRMKWAIVEFESGEEETGAEDALKGIFDQIDTLHTERVNAESGYQNASDTIKSMETELGELRRYKADNESAKAKAAREAVFAQFGDLVGVEAFDALREDCEEMEPQELEEKCFALRGRKSTTKFGTDVKVPKLPVDREPQKRDPYGDLFERYGSRKD